VKTGDESVLKWCKNFQEIPLKEVRSEEAATGVAKLF